MFIEKDHCHRLITPRWPKHVRLFLVQNLLFYYGGASAQGKGDSGKKGGQMFIFGYTFY